MTSAFILSKAAALKAINEGNGFRDGGYTGDGGRSDVAGVVHGQEFVTTAEDTKKHKGLLEAIHSGDSEKYRSALVRELIGTGITIDKDLPARLSAQRSNIASVTTSQLRQDNRSLELRLDETNKKLDELIRAGSQRTYSHNGELIKEKGLNKIVYKK